MLIGIYPPFIGWVKINGSTMRELVVMVLFFEIIKVIFLTFFTSNILIFLVLLRRR